MRVALIVNPHAGRFRPRDALPEVRECLEAAGCDVTLLETARRGDAEAFARGLRPGEVDRVLVAGGDGTLNEVANGLESPLPVGLIPLGTVNVLARELGIPVDDPIAACRLFQEGRVRPIDLGWCSGRRFVLMAGIGFDAEAVREVSPSVKDLIGAPAYVISGLKALIQMPRPIRYRLDFPGKRKRARGMMLVIANARSYAGFLEIAPAAAIDDGWLDLCLFRERSKWEFLRRVALALLRRPIFDSRVAWYRAREVRVETRPAAAVQLDGDYFGTTPVEVRVLPAAFRVVCPEQPNA